MGRIGGTGGKREMKETEAHGEVSVFGGDGGSLGETEARQEKEGLGKLKPGGVLAQTTEFV